MLLRARISTLKVTVPADLYTSGILVEIEGVEVQLGAHENANGDSSLQSSAEQIKKMPREAKADRPRNTQSLVHDPGGNTPNSSLNVGKNNQGDLDLSKQLPTTVDLAQSFLHEESPDKKEELKAAIGHFHRFEESRTLSQPGDSIPVYGVGNALSLPTFLADFLSGVGDRLQVAIKHVRIDLELDLDPHPMSLAGIFIANGSEKVTIRLSIEHVKLGAAKPSSTENSHVSDENGIQLDIDDQKDSKHDRKSRYIALTNIRGMLLGDASIFTSLSRFDQPLSPGVPKMSSAVKSDSKSPNMSRLTVDSSSNIDWQSRSPTIKHNERSLTSSIELRTSPITGENGSHTDAVDNYDLPVSGCAYHYEMRTNPDVDKTDSTYFQSQINTSDNEDLSTYQDFSPRRTTKSDDDAYSSYSLEGSDTQANTTYYSQQNDLFARNSAKRTQNLLSINLSRNPESNDLSNSLRSEDLTQSKILSNEEAKSVYMSAISHVSMPAGTTQYLLSKDQDGGNLSMENFNQSMTSSGGVQRQNSPGYNLTKEKPFEGDRGDEDLLDVVSSEQSVSSSPRVSPVLSTGLLQSNPAASSSGGNNDHAINNSEDTSQKLGNSSEQSDSPLIIVKSFMVIDSLSVELSKDKTFNEAVDGRTRSSQESTGKSSNVPTSFGYPSSSDNFEKSAIGTENSWNPSRAQEGPNDLCETDNGSSFSDWKIVVNVGKVEVLGDFGLTKLSILLIQHNLCLLNSNIAREAKDSALKKLSLNVKLRLTNITWKFLEVVKGIPIVEEESRVLSFVAQPFYEDSEILLSAIFDRVELKFSQNQSSTNTELSLGKVSFGYVSENILSFDPDVKMRQSTRDSLAPTRHDILLKISNTAQSLKIDLTTLPLSVFVDLRRLDETLNWFGGFSSILGLGSSVVSTVTTGKIKSHCSTKSKPQRGVHFESSLTSDQARRSQDYSQKVSARVGGLNVILQGNNCSFKLESSAVKFVNRLEGLGLQIDKARFGGPYFKEENYDPSIIINLVNVRMEYLSNPKEADLTRLLTLISPSNSKDFHNDDILLDTLLLQRRQGAVVRITMETLRSQIISLQHIHYVQEVVEELKKLSNVAKYLPDDDRPGILILELVRDLQCEFAVKPSFGTAFLTATDLEIGHVTLPSLTGFSVSNLKVYWKDHGELLGRALPANQEHKQRVPMITARFIGNEMEPIIKVRIYNLRVEYHVTVIMAALGLSEDSSEETIMNDLTSSVVTLKDPKRTGPSSSRILSHTSASSDKTSSTFKPTRLDIAVVDSVLSLNPRNSPSKALIVLTNAHVSGVLPEKTELNATLEIHKASIMLIDDTKNIELTDVPTSFDDQSFQGDLIQSLAAMGFVSVSYISSAKVTLNIVKSALAGEKTIELDIKDDLFVLETCADSTQTLLTVLNGLKPPSLPEKESKYRTQIISVENMLASLSGDAFEPLETREDDAHSPLGPDDGDAADEYGSSNLEFVGSYYNPNPESSHEDIAGSMLEDDLEPLALPRATRKVEDNVVLETFQDQHQIDPDHPDLEFKEDYFSTSSNIGGTAHRWDAKQNTYGLSNEFKVRESPLRLRVRNVHIIWNLFDGYDWQKTRDTISKAVAELEIKAAERLSRKESRRTEEFKEESEIGDFLFNSIYIGVTATRDPKDLVREVNRGINDFSSETESQDTYSLSDPVGQRNRHQRSRSGLHLSRSKQHKITFELSNVSADLVVFPTGEETQSSVDIRVQDIGIFDHIPSSTWKKFATYMHDAGERESGMNMIHLEIQNVKPVPTLTASEIVLKVRLASRLYT